MNIIKCENGHFFDGDKYTNCPHCDNNNVMTGMDGNPIEDIGATVLLTEEEDIFEVKQPVIEKKGRTSFFGRKDKKANMTVSGVSPMTISQRVQEQSRRSLEQEIFQAADYRIPETDMGKTVGFFANDNEGEPVVGWCVCVEGSEYGKSFNLKSGKNYIGRSAMMEVALLGDNKVSRDKHATIIFEPKKKEFIFMAGDTNGLCYLNDELVLQPASLKAYDEIGVGESKLVFVPFCGDKFNW